MLSESPTTTDAPLDREISSKSFEALDSTLETSGKTALIGCLIQDLDRQKAYRSLLDALLLKARVDLGLPVIPGRSPNDWPVALKTAYEDRYVEAIRTVGRKHLDDGDIAAAWPYFRAIGEPGPVSSAIDAYQPIDDGNGADERLHGIVEVAFNQGANPRKGFELILKHYGTCSAVTAFEHLPRDESIRAECAERLVRQLHAHLVNNLRGEIENRGQPLPATGGSIPALLADREWLFADESYHIDVSHLAATVRVSPLLQQQEALRLARELTEYGVKLSPKHSYEGDPPFEKVYEDHRIYLNALLGESVDQAVAHFEGKLSPGFDPLEQTEPSTDDVVTAQVIVGLLSRVGRPAEALDVASRYLAKLPDSSLFCPGIAQLAQESGNPMRLAEIARVNGDVVQYAMAILRRLETAP